MPQITKRERLEAAIAGQVADRPPVALWRHFPVDDQDPGSLAEACLAFQREYDFDFLKITPASSYCLVDWGVQDEWRGNSEGTREYTRRVIADPGDWISLAPLDPAAGALRDHLRCLELIEQAASGEFPFIPTIFSPLAQAKNLAGADRLLDHLRQHPQQVLRGLEVITQSTVKFIEAARGRGIAGVFYAVQHATTKLMEEESYTRFGLVFDRQILEAAEGLWLNLLHLHGEHLIFEVAESLPVAVVNWHDRQAGPSLYEGKARVAGAVCGGLKQWDTMVLGDPERVRAEASEAIDSLAGRGMILGTGCVVPIVAPRANLLAARGAVESA